MQPDCEFVRHTVLDPLRWSRRELVGVARICPRDPFSSMVHLFAPSPTPPLHPSAVSLTNPSPATSAAAMLCPPPTLSDSPMAAACGGGTPFEARPGLPQWKGTATRVGVGSVLLRQLLRLCSRGGGGSTVNGKSMGVLLTKMVTGRCPRGVEVCPEASTIRVLVGALQARSRQPGGSSFSVVMPGPAPVSTTWVTG